VAYRNPEREKAKKREWYLKNRERVLAEDRKRHADNRTREVEHSRAYYAKNRITLLEERRKKYATDPTYRTKVRDREIKSRYGMTADDFTAMLDEQGGRCAICGTPSAGPRAKGRRLHIDHDHGSGEVRGLLCTSCNTAIGMMDDSEDMLRAAILYLALWRGRNAESKVV
jgi:hypothetical protein